MYTIRKYKSKDKDYLRFICKETTRDIYKDNENKLDTIPMIFNDYFTENEPENIFVAVNENDIPVGYVICCTDIRKFRKTMLTDLQNRVLTTYPLSVFMLWAVVISVMITKKKYRTHLHIDLLESAQRQGLGTELINNLCNHLKTKSIRNVSVITINKQSMGYKFYCKYGFRIVQQLSKNIITMTFDIK